jgi:hypothetical protein
LAVLRVLVLVFAEARKSVGDGVVDACCCCQAAAAAASWWAGPISGFMVVVYIEI